MYSANGIPLSDLFEPREYKPLNEGWATDATTKWYSTLSSSEFSIVTPTDAPETPSCLQILSSQGGGGERFYSIEKIPVDPAKRYRVSTWARQIGSTQNCYLLVGFYNDNGLISSNDTPSNLGLGWDAAGSFNYWEVIAEPFPDEWTFYSYEFGNGQTAQIPPSATEMVIGALTSRDSTTAEATQFNNYRVEEIPVETGDLLYEFESFSGVSGTEADHDTYTFSTTYTGTALLRLYINDAEGGIAADFNGTRLDPLLRDEDQVVRWYEFEVDVINGTNSIEVYRISGDGYQLYKIECVKKPDGSTGPTPGPNNNYFKQGSNFSTLYETIEHNSRIPDINYFAEGVSISRLFKGNISQFSTALKAETERTTSWNGTISSSCRASFSSINDLEDFFTYGGRIMVSSSRYAGSDTPKNREWGDIISDAGRIELAKSVSLQNTNNVISTIGADNLTSSYQLIYSGSGTSAYTSAVYSVFARKPSATDIDIRVTFTDGSSGVIDEDINGVLKVYYNERKHPTQNSATYTMLENI